MGKGKKKGLTLILPRKVFEQVAPSFCVCCGFFLGGGGFNSFTHHDILKYHPLPFPVGLPFIPGEEEYVKFDLVFLLLL